MSNIATLKKAGIVKLASKLTAADKRALESLSTQTGGVAFFPRNLEEVDDISRAVARDIRNQYSITYKPTNPQSNGGYRTVKVVARAPGYKDLQVRTRTAQTSRSGSSRTFSAWAYKGTRRSGRAASPDRSGPVLPVRLATSPC